MCDGFFTIFKRIIPKCAVPYHALVLELARYKYPSNYQLKQRLTSAMLCWYEWFGVTNLHSVNGSRLATSYSSVHFYVSGLEISERARDDTSRVLKLMLNGTRAFLASITLVNLWQSRSIAVSSPGIHECLGMRPLLNTTVL